jgi:hypothetical protein
MAAVMAAWRVGKMELWTAVVSAHKMVDQLVLLMVPHLEMHMVAVMAAWTVDVMVAERVMLMVVYLALYWVDSMAWK